MAYNRSLDPLTAFQIKKQKQKMRKRIERARYAVFKMKGTRDQIQRSIDNTSDNFLRRFLIDWHNQYTKSINCKRQEIVEDRFYLLDK